MKGMHKVHLAGMKKHLANVQREMSEPMSEPSVVEEKAAFASLPREIQLALELDFGSQVHQYV